MVKHTQTLGGFEMALHKFHLISDGVSVLTLYCVVFDPFVGLALKRLMTMVAA